MTLVPERGAAVPAGGEPVDPPRDPIAGGTGAGTYPPRAVAGLLALAAGGAAAAAGGGAASMAGLLLAAALAGVALRLAGPGPAVLAVLVASVFQNLLAIPLAGGLDAGAVMALLLAKEVLAAAVLAAGVILAGRRLRLLPADLAALVYGLVVVAVAIGAGVSSFAGLATVRQALTLPFLWLVGRTAAAGGDDAGRVVGAVLRIGLVVAAFGLVERFVLGDRFWADLGIATFYERKGLEEFLTGTLPGNFFSWDWGPPTRRLVGTFGEPTTVAHLLAMPAALALAAPSVAGPRRGAALALGAFVAIALACTLGKSGIATFLAGVAAGLWFRGRAWRLAGLGASAIAGAAFLVAAAASPNLQKNLFLHGDGLLAIVEDGAGLVGHGFGTAGNFTAALADLAAKGAPTESFVAVLAFQGGVFPVLAYVGFTAAATWALLAPVVGGAPRDVRAVLAGLVAATALTSLASETPVAFLAGGLVFLVAGALAAPPPGSRPSP